MLLFYRAVVESVLRYVITVWFGNLTVKVKSQINRLTRSALKIVGVRDYPTLQAIYEESVLRQARKIIEDPSHVLNRYRFYFVPVSVNLLNSCH